jgi:thioredoxin-like negative regulator of GroEL
MPTLQDGKNAIDRGNLQQARLIFEAILQETPRSVDAWLGLAEVLTETEDKRICYENVLKIDKSNQAAKEGLRNLEPQADPLVAALAPQPPPQEVDEPDFDEDDGTIIAAGPNLGPADEAEGETPTALLVAVGLALSVVVFAAAGGIVFFLLTALTGQ